MQNTISEAHGGKKGSRPDLITLTSARVKPPPDRQRSASYSLGPAWAPGMVDGRLEARRSRAFWRGSSSITTHIRSHRSFHLQEFLTKDHHWYRVRLPVVGNG
jgi:hypothetical protein